MAHAAPPPPMGGIPPPLYYHGMNYPLPPNHHIWGHNLKHPRECNSSYHINSRLGPKKQKTTKKHKPKNTAKKRQKNSGVAVFWLGPRAAPAGGPLACACIKAGPKHLKTAAHRRASFSAHLQPIHLRQLGCLPGAPGIAICPIARHRGRRPLGRLWCLGPLGPNPRARPVQKTKKTYQKNKGAKTW